MTPRITPEAKAWACFGANALVLPGLGSLLAGRWLAGLLQAALSLAGFAMTLAWTLSWLGRAVREGSLPLDPGPYFQQAVAGVLGFGLGWAWGILTGVALLREARRGRRS